VGHLREPESAQGAGFRGSRRRVTGEPDAVKAARPVRRGADGKGPERSGTSPAAYPTSYALAESDGPSDETDIPR
jgi:hypothetical protein